MLFILFWIKNVILVILFIMFKILYPNITDLIMLLDYVGSLLFWIIG